MSKSKCTKNTRFGALLEVAMSKKCTPLWREAHFEVKMLKTPRVRTLLDVQMSFRLAGARDCAPCQKRAKREGFVAFPKTMAGVGHLKRICKDVFSIIFRGRHSTRDMFIKDVRRSGRWFPERGCILEHQIYFRFAEIVLRDRCSTSYDLASLFRGRRNTLDRWGGLEKSQTQWYEAVSSALNFPFLKEVSQNCFVFDVANFEKWGSLAELLRFWRWEVSLSCCVFDVVKFKKFRKSRRIASFSSVQIDR